MNLQEYYEYLQELPNRVKAMVAEKPAKAKSSYQKNKLKKKVYAKKKN